VRRAGVMALWDGFNRGRVHWSRVWAIAALQLWLAEFNRATAAPTATLDAIDPREAAAGR
jgi:hypothetical protein